MITNDKEDEVRSTWCPVAHCAGDQGGIDRVVGLLWWSQDSHVEKDLTQDHSDVNIFWGELGKRVHFYWCRPNGKVMNHLDFEAS